MVINAVMTKQDKGRVRQTVILENVVREGLSEEGTFELRLREVRGKAILRRAVSESSQKKNCNSNRSMSGRDSRLGSLPARRQLFSTYLTHSSFSANRSDSARSATGGSSF